MHLEPDRLMLLALGEEPVTADVADHLASCPRCQAELESLRDVVDLGRHTDGLRDLPSPAPRVWDGIMRQILAESQLLSDRQAAALAGPSGQASEREMAPSARTATDDVIGRPTSPGQSNGHPPTRPATGDATDPPPRGSATASPAGGPGRSRILQATAIAVTAAIIGVAGTLGIVALRDSDGTKLVSRAQLAALPAAPAGAHGSAEVVHVGLATELRLTLSGMPTPPGYYEAWLFDPAGGTMFPMGPITASGGTVTVTGVDLGRYRGVDISAQAMDGRGGHGQTMLRGALQ